MLILSHFSRVLFNFQSAFFIYLNGCGCSRFQLSIAAEFLDSLPHHVIVNNKRQSECKFCIYLIQIHYKYYESCHLKPFSLKKCRPIVITGFIP